MGCAESREKTENSMKPKIETEGESLKDIAKFKGIEKLLDDTWKRKDMPEYKVRNQGTSEDIINSLKANWEIMHKRVEKRLNIEMQEEITSSKSQKDSEEDSDQESELDSEKSSEINPDEPLPSSTAEINPRARYVRLFTNILKPGAPIINKRRENQK